MKFSFLLLVCLLMVGCGGAEKARKNFEAVLDGSPVVFVCLVEDKRYVVKEVLKADPSWGSNVRVGDAIDIPIRNDPREMGALVTRGRSLIAVNGQIDQGSIPFDRAGRMLFGPRMTIGEVKEYLSKQQMRP